MMEIWAQQIEKLKSFHDEQEEHLTCRGCRTIAYRACTRCTGYIRMWRKLEKIFIVVVSDARVKKEVRCNS
jgi:hypothetical protein